MIVVIAGSRDITDYELVERAIKESGLQITMVLCGQARGVDTLGEQWAKANNIPVRYYPANWKTYGKQAGVLRNRYMAEDCDAVIVIHNGSPGSKNMLDEARRKKRIVFEKRV